MALLIIAVLLVGVLLREQTASTQGRVAQAGTAASLPPTVNRIVDTNAIDIKAGHYLTYTFTSNDPRVCVVDGHVLGLAGGNKDVEVLLFDGDGLTNFKNNNTAKTLFNGGKATATTISARLPGSGSYYLVLSNVFSILTDKTVQVRATLTCR